IVLLILSFLIYIIYRQHKKNKDNYNINSYYQKFTFEDHIPCMTAKQNLIKGRQRARQIKLSKIASILEIQTTSLNTINQSKMFTNTNYTQYQLGKDFNLTVVRNCPVK
ncbi:unnamed protein product, partial [Rotaria sp. Silwood1]